VKYDYPQDQRPFCKAMLVSYTLPACKLDHIYCIQSKNDFLFSLVFLSYSLVLY
jgi:hypothetical protein